MFYNPESIILNYLTHSKFIFREKNNFFLEKLTGTTIQKNRYAHEFKKIVQHMWTALVDPVHNSHREGI